MSAREHFLKAIDMATNGLPWIAYEGFAESYSGSYRPAFNDSGADHKKAIYWMHKAINSNPPASRLYDLYQSLTWWHLYLGRVDRTSVDDGCEAGRAAYEASKGYNDNCTEMYAIFFSIRDYLRILSLGARFKTTIDLIRELWHRRSVDGRSMLAKCMGLGGQIYDFVGDAIDSQIDPEFTEFFLEEVTSTVKCCVKEPHDDLAGYKLLGRTLMLSGDGRDATIALGMTMQPLSLVSSSSTDQLVEDPTQEVPDAFDSSLPTDRETVTGHEEVAHTIIQEPIVENQAPPNDDASGSFLSEHADAQSGHDRPDTEEEPASQNTGDSTPLQLESEEAGTHETANDSAEDERTIKIRYALSEPESCPVTRTEEPFRPWSCSGPCTNSFGTYLELHF